MKWTLTKTAAGKPKIADHHGFSICNFPDATKDSRANAELIARAPELLEENETLKADLKLVNSCWQTDMKQIRDLESINKELLDALEMTNILLKSNIGNLFHEWPESKLIEDIIAKAKL